MKENRVKYPYSLKRSDIIAGEMNDPVEQSLLIGNGDISAVLYRWEDELVLNLTKNDIWDRRLDTSCDPDILTTDGIIKMLEEAKGSESDINDEIHEKSKSTSYALHPYPCPLMFSCIKIKCGLPEACECHRLSLEEAAVYSYFNKNKQLRIFSSAVENAYIITGITAGIEIRLEPVYHVEMGTPEIVETGHMTWIKQEIPGDIDVPPMSFSVVLSCRPGSNFACIAVATSKEYENPSAKALEIVENIEECTIEDHFRKHKDWWGSFWSASGIKLADSFLESIWYRYLYFLGCASRQGKTAPALFMGLIDKNTPWHGDYHMNINSEQTFWGCYAANHPELSESYDELIVKNLKRAKWIAKKLFNVDGAFYSLVMFSDEPEDPEQCRSRNGRQYIHDIWSRTLGISAFCAQNLWWHYLYTKDINLLKYLYPVIKEAAKFYINWNRFYPTVSPEHWGLTPRLERNRNCTFDLALIRFIVKAVVEASAILETDEDLRVKCQKFLECIPDYPVSKGVEPVIVDVEGAPPISYNIPVPVYPVFPGEDISLYSKADKVELAARTVEKIKTDFRDPMTLSMARIRIGMQDAFSYLRLELKRSIRRNGTFSVLPEFHVYNRLAYATQECGIVLPVTELLFQSFKGIIRLFPAWPKELNAEFSDLRAIGALLVSAVLKNGKISDVVIKSLKGGQVMLKNEWQEFYITDENKKNVEYLINSDDIILFDSLPGETYFIMS